ncbi:MAG: gamma-glutamyl-gamma-aminobutyrate hydrolase family protein [Gammaproteobacteria bacterium]|nr:gamma-glutamyl-gamma-aminobutyrate hydrolase family protein [Gammaproteobacteria bacterium]
MQRNKPLVGVVSDRRLVKNHHFHMVGEKYLVALIAGAGVYPVAIPSLSAGFDVLDILERLDGLFLPGSPSNVAPEHYNGEPIRPGTWLDPERDEAALPLIPAAVRTGLPLFAVCRGFQEMNVAFGGTLHQHIHEVPGYRHHQENPDEALDVQYGPSHEVDFVPGGLLAEITRQQSTIVNSLHSQAVDRLADGLAIEATADDGLIEAFVVKDAPGFTLGIQWHPEWRVQDNNVSLSIFQAFGDACQIYQSA